jgi:SAM-dependent methyltransferase
MSLYQKAKRIISAIIPRSFLFRYENFFRYLYAFSYSGNNYQCNICGKKLKSFVDIEKDRLCPRCGSLQRTRRLWQILEAEFLSSKPKILDFSPSRSIYRKLKKGKYNYTSSDLSGNFLADVSWDITRIDAPDNSFDLIICYHILEHIEDDGKAMEELVRILKPGGTCIIQTPFKDGDIYEDLTITTPEDRLLHFGQDDHVRIYSIDGLQERLKNAGFKTEIREFEESPNNFAGFNKNETVLVCNK